jgi:radical SAM protein with 4Fe4S-binding SPASM domain
VRSLGFAFESGGKPPHSKKNKKTVNKGDKHLINMPLNHTLRLVFFETTAGCNLECSHCRRLDASRETGRDDLSRTHALGLIDQIAEFSSPIIVFSGGEPLIREDIFELMSHAVKKNLKVALATNGILVSEETALKIKQTGVERVSVSFDGADSHTHNHFRKITGSFEAALKGTENLIKLDVGVQINMTVARHNASQLNQMFELASNLSVSALHLFMLVPVGCGVEIAGEEMLSPQEYEQVLLKFFELSNQYDLMTKATCAPHYFRIKMQKGKSDGIAESGVLKTHARDKLFHSETRGCLAGSSVLFVSHRGQVFPCGYLPVEAGNIKNTRMKDIWEKSGVFALLRRPDLLKGKCGICRYRRICMGCRARAFYKSGDYMDEEPYCVYEPLRI